MIKVVFLVLMAFMSLYAECECDCQKCCYQNEQADNSIGVIFSYGEGSGVSYRSNFESFYIQHAGFIYLEKYPGYESTQINYGLSYGKYLFSSNNDYVHLKAVMSTEVDYNHESDEGYLSTYEAYRVGGGVGFEIGKRARGSIMYGFDALYIYKYHTADNYQLTPSMALYMQYNF